MLKRLSFTFILFQSLFVYGADGYETLPYEGNVQEFVYWQSKNQIVYRNHKGAVHLVNIQNDNTKRLASSNYPLASLTDSGEKYLLTKGTPHFLDTLHSNQWVAFSDIPLEYGFWMGDRLYSIAEVPGAGLGTEYRIVRYHAGNRFTQPICNNVSINSAEGYHIAEGHTAPYLFFYKQKKCHLVIKSLNVKTCEFKVHNENGLVAEGISSVRWFESLQSLAIQWNRDSDNVLWTGTGNFSTAQNNATFVNPSLPLMATFTNDNKIELVNLSTGSRTAVLNGEVMFTDHAQGVVVSNDQKSLYIASKIKGPKIQADFSQGKGIVKVDLETP